MVPLHLPTRPLLLSPSYRITIGNKTCVFEKENDPTVLRAPSAGKLLQYTVADEGHVEAGSSYAEMEVSTEPVLGVGPQPGLPSTPLPGGGPSRIAPAPLHPSRWASPLPWATICPFFREPVWGVQPQFAAVFKGKT